MSTGNEARKAVYVVFGRKYYTLGARLNKLLSLRTSYEKMSLVSLGGYHDNDRDVTGGDITITPLPNPTGAFRRIGLSGLGRFLDRYLFFPSKDILFVGRMQRELGCRIKADLADGLAVCLITSAPPHCVGMVGLYLKRKFSGIRWIMDWRDLWSYDENYLNKSPPVYHRRLLDLEKEMLERCDLNLTTNLFATQVLMDKYGVPAGKASYVNHAYCREDAPSKIPAPDRNEYINGGRELRIGFLGTLFKPPRVPGLKVLEAIRHTRDAGLNVRLHHYGAHPVSMKDSIPADDDIFVSHGRKEYQEGLREIAGCDILLVVLADLPNSRAVMSVKLPDYFLVNRPIIAIVPEPSAIAGIIKATNSGFVIPANLDWNVELVTLLKNLVGGAALPERNEEEIEKYDWENVSRRWIEVIDGSDRATIA